MIKEEFPVESGNDDSGLNCPVCGSSIVYVNTTEEGMCELCHKVDPGSTHCTNGHFICEDCRINIVFESTVDLRNSLDTKDPVEVFQVLMKEQILIANRIKYQIIVGVSLIIAYCNAIGDRTEMDVMLREMVKNARSFPTDFCANSGSCGAGISAGVFFNIISKSTDFNVKEYGLSNILTSRCLEKISNVGGSRCCRRSALISIEESVKYVEDSTGISMEMPNRIVCDNTSLDGECMGQECPFFGV